MCSHYVAEKARQQLARFGVQLPLDWEPGPGSRHIYPTQWAPIVRRPPEHDSGDDAVPDRELVLARFGLLPGFAKDEKYGLRTYNARSETVASLASFKGSWAPGLMAATASFPHPVFTSLTGEAVNMCRRGLSDQTVSPWVSPACGSLGSRPMASGFRVLPC